MTLPLCLSQNLWHNFPRNSPVEKHNLVELLPWLHNVFGNQQRSKFRSFTQHSHTSATANNSIGTLLCLTRNSFSPYLIIFLAELHILVKRIRLIWQIYDYWRVLAIRRKMRYQKREKLAQKQKENRKNS